MKCICPQCREAFDAKTGRVNRAASIGAPLYCGRECSGLVRRSGKTAEQKKAEKAEYDRKRLAELSERIKAEKRAYYEANKAYKHEYDAKRNEAEYGEFAEAWRLLLELEKEIRSQATAYERRVAKGYYTRSAQRRRRELCRLKKSLTLAT